MEKYTFNVFWSDEDNCFICTITEYPGLSAFGENLNECLNEAQTALEGFKQVEHEDSIDKVVSYFDCTRRL